MLERSYLDRVRACHEADYLNLFALYTRWVLLSGKADATGHDVSPASLVRCFEAEHEAWPHSGELLDRWRGSKRPVPRYARGDGFSLVGR